MKTTSKSNHRFPSFLSVPALAMFIATQLVIADSIIRFSRSLSSMHVILFFSAGALGLAFLISALAFRKQDDIDSEAAAYQENSMEGTERLLTFLKVLYETHSSLADAMGNEPLEGAGHPSVSIEENLGKLIDEWIEGLAQERVRRGKEFPNVLKDVFTCLDSFSSIIESLQSGIKDLVDENRMLIEGVSGSAYELKTVIQVVKNLIETSEKYEAETLTGIFRKFEEIWDYSKALVEDSENTLRLFSKGSDEERSLAYIAEKNGEIGSRFQTFSETFETLEKNSRSLLESSINGLNEIREASGSIEDLAERIKVISINVRIEAARESGRDSGFNVLGQEITSFADQTTDYANSTIEQIEDTIRRIRPLRNELLNDLKQVREDMQTIQSIMAPYQEIVDRSFVHMDKIITNLNDISSNISGKMRQTIGNMQYHDITNQEANHIICLLDAVEKKSRDNFQHLSEIKTPEGEMRQKILEEVATWIESLITTGSEREVLNAFKADKGLDENDVEIGQGLSDIRTLDEKTILF